MLGSGGRWRGGNENEEAKGRSSSRGYRVMGPGSMDDLGNPIGVRFPFPMNPFFLTSSLGLADHGPGSLNLGDLNVT